MLYENTWFQITFIGSRNCKHTLESELISNINLVPIGQPQLLVLRIFVLQRARSINAWRKIHIELFSNKNFFLDVTGNTYTVHNNCSWTLWRSIHPFMSKLNPINPNLSYTCCHQTTKGQFRGDRNRNLLFDCAPWLHWNIIQFYNFYFCRKIISNLLFKSFSWFREAFHD